MSWTKLELNEQRQVWVILRIYKGSYETSSVTSGTKKFNPLLSDLVFVFFFWTNTNLTSKWVVLKIQVLDFKPCWLEGALVQVRDVPGW